MPTTQKPYSTKSPRWVVAFVGMTCLAMTGLAAGATCEGDHLAIPDAAGLPAVQARAIAGDTYAQAKMGAAYLRGKGVKPDTAQALAWLEKSAAGGNSEGQYLLGEYYAVNGKTDGDFHKAAGWLRRSMGQGCLPALFGLGLLTEGGKGVPKNTTKGLHMITAAAKAGYPVAQWWLGAILITGKGIRKDPQAGFTWIKRAADAGESGAEIFLASLYLTGTGTPPNPARARALLESVYAKRDEQAPAAAYSLGWMYMEGKGVPVNTPKAFEWMIIAAGARVSDSVQRLKTLTAELPKQTLAMDCNVYLDPAFLTDGAKPRAQVKGGENIAVLYRGTAAGEVYFPARGLLGFVPRECLGSSDQPFRTGDSH